MFQNFDEFGRQWLVPAAALFLCYYFSKIAWLWWKQRDTNKNWREVPQAKFNENGMIMPSRSALVCSPVEKNALLNNTQFPDDLAGFMAYLSPGEISTILLEIKKGQMTEKKKDIRRAVTIAAAHYQFYVPHALLLLDARTHELYAAFMNAMELVKPNKENVFNMGMPSPVKEYETAAIVTGHVLVHFALKGNFPSLTNFAKTVNKNLPGMKNFHVEEIQCFATAYAYVTDMILPRHYVRYNELTDALVYSGIGKEAIVIDLKPHLTLVQ